MQVFDSHLHIIDPRFPLVANQGYVPEPFTVTDYLARTRSLGVVGGTIVSGSFQAHDQEYLFDALKTLGPAFVGVTQLPVTVTDDRIRELDRVGVRAVRFNFKRDAAIGPSVMSSFARRIHDLVGWHVELYVDGGDLPGLFDTLVALPKVVIDHLALSRSGLPALLRLVEHGVCVKATGFGRLDFDPRPVLRDLANANPNALLFGTDLPSTRATRAFRDSDLHLMLEVLTQQQAEKALFENAVVLYRPESLNTDEEPSN